MWDKYHWYTKSIYVLQISIICSKDERGLEEAIPIGTLIGHMATKVIERLQEIIDNMFSRTLYGRTYESQ